MYIKPVWVSPDDIIEIIGRNTGEQNVYDQVIEVERRYKSVDRDARYDHIIQYMKNNIILCLQSMCNHKGWRLCSRGYNVKVRRVPLWYVEHVLFEHVQSHDQGNIIRTPQGKFIATCPSKHFFKFIGGSIKKDIRTIPGDYYQVFGVQGRVILRYNKRNLHQTLTIRIKVLYWNSGAGKWNMYS